MNPFDEIRGHKPYVNPIAEWLGDNPMGPGKILHPSTVRQDNMRSLHTQWGIDHTPKTPTKDTKPEKEQLTAADIKTLKPNARPELKELIKALTEARDQCRQVSNQTQALQQEEKIARAHTITEQRYLENCRRLAERRLEEARKLQIAQTGLSMTMQPKNYSDIAYDKYGRKFRS